MPIIPLNEKYRLVSDYRSWELQENIMRKHRKTGKPVQEWSAVRWYSNLEGALHDAAEVCLRTSKCDDISKAIKEVKDILAGIRQALAGELNGNQKGKI